MTHILICNVKYCRLSHFDYVKSEDLEKIGMAKPAIRRLLDTVRKRKTKVKKKGILQKVPIRTTFIEK